MINNNNSSNKQHHNSLILNSNNLTNSSPSLASPIITNGSTSSVTQSTDLFFNKYNHLTQYQQQQNLLNNNNQSLNLNNSLNRHSNQNAPLSNRLSAPVTPAPMPPVLGYNNLTYFAPPKLNQTNEQQSLDSGFLNLFHQQSIEPKNNVQAAVVPVVRNPSSVKSKRKSKQQQAVNLIDLESSVDVARVDDLSIVDLFDPLSRVKQQQQQQTMIEYSSESESDNDVKIEPKEEEAVKLATRRVQLQRSQTVSADSKPQQETFSTKIETFKIIDSNTPIEFDNFNESINKLNKEIKVNQKNLSNLIVFSPLLDCPLTQTKNIKITVRYTSNESYTRFKQEIITTSFNATVETLVYQVLSLFDIEELNTEKYLLKIHGCEEYLPVNANLADLKYLHECLTENKDPILNLTEISDIKTELNSTISDQHYDSLNESKPFKFSNKIEKNKMLISQMKLEKLLQNIIQNKKLIEEAVAESDAKNDELSQLSTLINWCCNLKEKFKFLASVICNVHFNCIEAIVDKLDHCERNLRNNDQVGGYQLTDTNKQPLVMKSFEKFENEYCVIENKSSNETLAFLYANLIEIASDGIQAIIVFVNCASESYNFPFRLKTNVIAPSLYENIEIIQAEEKFFLYFKGLSRLSSFLSEKVSSSTYDLFIRFSIQHGGQTLESVSLKLDKYDKFVQNKIDFFTIDQHILFNKIDLCLLAREAVLVIQLCSSNDTSTLKCLAWTSKCLFNEHLQLRQGDYLMNFYCTDMPTICTSASNIFSNKCPVVQISLMQHSNSKQQTFRYIYPSTDQQQCDIHLKDFQSLDSEVKEELLLICNKSNISKSLCEDDKDLLHKYHLYLNGIPNALAKIYLSFSSWDYSSMIHFEAYLKQCDPISLAESLEILLPSFAQYELRKHAILSLQTYSAETIALYLPQLLEALKYEYTHSSFLISILLTFAFKNIRFAHRLYWQVREFKSRTDDYLYIRYEMLHQALMYLLSKPMRQEIEQENFLLDNIDRIGNDVKKNSKDHSKLLNELESFQQTWLAKFKATRLPFNISYCTREIEVKSCSVISSFTMPLKLVFKNIDSTANSFYTIYKIGDDLRQDSFVLQLINVMNQMWIMEGLDLNVLTFTCLQTGDRRGFIEMITNAETLKEIQKGEVMKAFKQGCINDWLKSHNPNPNNFAKAVRNFTKSCAAYSVATYLLGIGDRHNDNIMVKYTGHMFHIDFGKYLGDAQTFVGIKRDRSPMLFTSDMFHVINQGKQANVLFQEFIEMCCRAFQIVRKNYHLILTLIELMTNSGIPGLNNNAISFVHKNLMLDLDEDRSSNAFKKLIHDSISKFASFNFAIHSLAQPKTVNSSNYFSFVTHTYNAETDGHIVNIALDDENSSDASFKCVVARQTEYHTNEVYRTFDEFCELYQLLVKTYPTLRLAETPLFNRFKEAKQFIKRRQCVYLLLKDLMKLQPEISQSDIVYTFFHSILRDQKEDFIYLSESKVYSKEKNDEEVYEFLRDNHETSMQDLRGQIKVKLKFNNNKLIVNCLQCRNLRAVNSNQSVSTLKPYVKCYLRPDSTKATKKKVQALFNGANPIFTEMMEYDLNLIDFRSRTLEITVLNNSNIIKERIGSVHINLAELDFRHGDYIRWYDLC